MVTQYRPPMPDPCGACPFRRKALAGWLGAGSPESFVECVLREEPLPCHKSIDYSSKTWLQDWIDGEVGKMCKGAMIFTANIGKLPRDRAFPRASPDKDNIFASPQEFIDHHRAGRVHSWDMDGEEKRAAVPTQRGDAVADPALEEVHRRGARPRRRGVSPAKPAVQGTRGKGPRVDRQRQARRSNAR